MDQIIQYFILCFILSNHCTSRVLFEDYIPDYLNKGPSPNQLDTSLYLMIQNPTLQFKYNSSNTYYFQILPKPFFVIEWHGNIHLNNNSINILDKNTSIQVLFYSSKGSYLEFDNSRVYYDWEISDRNVIQNISVDNVNRNVSHNFTFYIYETLDYAIVSFQMPSPSIILNSLYAFYCRYDPTLQKGLLKDMRVLSEYKPTINPSPTGHMYRWSGFLVPVHQSGTLRYNLSICGDFAMKFVLDGTKVFSFEGENYCMWIVKNMTMGNRYKFELYAINDHPILQWSYQFSNSGIPLFYDIPPEAFSDIIEVDGPLITKEFSIENPNITINGDLIVDKIYTANNSFLQVNGNLIVNDFIIINPSSSINISQCISGNGTIILKGPILSNTLSYHNCATPPNLPVEFNFNDSCSSFDHNYHYAKTSLEMSVKLKNEEICTDDDDMGILLKMALPIVFSCLGIILVIMLIYIVIRRRNYKKAMSHFDTEPDTIIQY